MSDDLQDGILNPLLEQYPDAATLTLARMAYNGNPEVWPTLESCRCAVRLRRGNMGTGHRRTRVNTKHFRPPQSPGNPFGELPEGFRQIQDFTPYIIQDKGRALLLPDIHFPYHDRRVFVLACERDADAVLLNGDTWDCFACSKWETDPRERDLPYELACVQEGLSVVRKTHPKARIVYKIGNHEERWERYLKLKAPELLGVSDFQIEKLLRFDDYGVECVRDKRPIRLGSILYVIHGHEWRQPFANPVNPARGLFLRAKTVAMCSHMHQASTHQATALNGKIIRTWSTGCLCDLHPRYAPINDWSHGFAEVDIDSEGSPSVNLRAIIDGKVW